MKVLRPSSKFHVKNGQSKYTKRVNFLCLCYEYSTVWSQMFHTIANYSHCSNWEKVLNENDTPQNQQFLSVYTLEVPKYSKLEKSIGIRGKNSKLG